MDAERRSQIPFELLIGVMSRHRESVHSAAVLDAQNLICLCPRCPPVLSFIIFAFFCITFVCVTNNEVKLFLCRNSIDRDRRNNCCDTEAQITTNHRKWFVCVSTAVCEPCLNTVYACMCVCRAGYYTSILLWHRSKCSGSTEYRLSVPDWL